MRRWGWAVGLALWCGCKDTDRDRLTSIADPSPVAPVEAPVTPPDAPQTFPPDDPNEQETVEPPPETPKSNDPTPVSTKDGIPGPLPGVYTDKGPAAPDALIRGLVSFPIRRRAQLEETIADLYNPQSSRFRRYLTPAEWMDRHAPPEDDVRVVVDWLKSQGLQVPRIATNRLYVQFLGTVQQFNDAFHAELRVLERKSPQMGNDPHDVYGLPGGIQAPKFVQDRIHGVVAADLAVAPGTLPVEYREASPPPADLSTALSPAQVARAYNVDTLYARGFRGRGVRLGVTIGASIRLKDVRAFWQAFGLQRSDPVVIHTMEDPITRYREGALDVEWAGAMAPEADLLVYAGPDARNTSMMYTFNEAIAQGKVDVITDSFAHREDSEPRPVHEAYSHSAMMAAALGISVLSASGDSAGVDVPSNSPYVTSVGGTILEMQDMAVTGEVLWYYAGSGVTRTFATPRWQEQLPAAPAKRAVPDVALNAETPYWFVFLGDWRPNTGTSFASPIFAGIVAVLNQGRAQAGKPWLGWLNEHLYTVPAARAAFRDITEGRTQRQLYAGPGWDNGSGWGAPDAEKLLNAMP